MQVSAESNRLSIKIVIFFLLTAIAAYLPVSSFLFSLKNDAFTGYFPPKFFMSESLKYGYLPLWNPYINFGIPQYGDMSSGFWSPVTWLVALVGYNPYTFTIEELFYIFLSGLGMFYLTGYWKLSTYNRLTTGVIYMCSGYIVGHLQHFNWVSAAAFLPWCTGLLLYTLQQPTLRACIKTGLAFFMLISSAHPGIIIGSFYFFFMIIIAFILEKKVTEKKKQVILKTAQTTAIILIAVILISLGPIIAYAEIIQHITRGEKVTFYDVYGTTTLQSWLSLILPLSSTKNESFFISDISLRNCYLGSFYFLILLYSLFTYKCRWQWALAFTATFFIILSAGAFSNNSFSLPLIGYVRLSGEFRIFALIALILYLAIEFERFIQHAKSKLFNRVFLFFLAILLFAFFFSLLKSTPINTLAASFTGSNNIRETLKVLLDNISFYDAIALQSAVSILLLLICRKAVTRKTKSLYFLIMAEIILATLMNTPFTGVGKASVKEVESILSHAPEGFPVPPLNPTNTNSIISDEKMRLVGHWSFYNKEIGVTSRVQYPIVLNNTVTYFEQDNTLLDTKPYLFADNMHTIPIITHYEPNQITFNVEAPAGTTFTYKQNHYPYWTASINNESVPVGLAYKVFLSVTTPTEGKQEIAFRFQNDKMKLLIFFSLSFFLALSGFVIFRPKKVTKKKIAGL